MKERTLVYYNPSYDMYDNKECYVMYIVDRGMYIMNPNDAFKWLQRATFEISEDNIDSYLETRGFSLVIDYTSEKHTWHHGFERPDRKAKFKSDMERAGKILYDKLKFKYVNDFNLIPLYAAIEKIKRIKIEEE